MGSTYEDFGPVDFVTDDRFLKHQLSPTAESVAFWEEYLRSNPHKNPEWQQARELLNAVLLGLTSYSRTYLSEQEEARLLDKILKSTEQYDAANQVKPLRQYTRWYLLAAAVVALAIVATGYMLWRPEGFSKSTYDETIAVLENNSKVTRHRNRSSKPELYQLPDSSSVLLDPQSEISFASEYNRENRCVYLSGKAILDVVPDASKPFYVYANEVVTKVLGTKFEVIAFHDGSDVTVRVLSGKVTVYQGSHKTKESADAPKKSTVLLLPNQFVVFDRKAELFDSKGLVEYPVSLPNVKSLPKFEYEDDYAVRFFDDITNAYGVNVVYDHETLKKCQFSAAFSNQSLREMLDVVCKTIGASYEIIDAQVIISTTGCKQ
ncbi:FecR family protein [Dyadobacter sp. LJ53]|uniref:FecR family protein n=1 Tax=Dyadobacter chenwenxiniae TaxID=2906456 RepID=UPI001F3811CA|nr:FecR family protein [Dyadobacter chenwenxiniae]MCF0052488.1 FecR family protein [Dyadobacter chenwenxiniae]